jgi:hypothetical protein
MIPRGRVLAVIAMTAVIAAQSASNAAAPKKPEAFAQAAGDAVAALIRGFYAGDGRWRACTAASCSIGNRDWGDDSLTYALALRYTTTRSPALLSILRALAASAPTYPQACASPSPCSSWSDVPEWDAIALAQEYLSTGAPDALAKAERAFAFVEQSAAYSLGACPRIRYQQPGGGPNKLKTLETDGNAVKAALLLYRATRRTDYLASARERYDAVRAYFLDPAVPLYTVYVFDNGPTCTPLPHRFFASVNGDMIWSGVELFRDTGVRRYLAEALATAQAVDRRLGDGRGVYADLQAENDIVEPLVEAMQTLAATGRAAFARAWILRNARAALSARSAAGLFGRFFDGPPPATTVTEWQANGGAALEIAAAALAPDARVPTASAWSNATFVPREVVSTGGALTVRGSGVALLGTLGEQCCEPGHARVLIDGRETFDETGIWQNKSSSGQSIDGTVLFAWRWQRAGTHTIGFAPGIENAKEGGSFLHLRGYLVLR